MNYNPSRYTWWNGKFDDGYHQLRSRNAIGQQPCEDREWHGYVNNQYCQLH